MASLYAQADSQLCSNVFKFLCRCGHPCWTLFVVLGCMYKQQSGYRHRCCCRITSNVLMDAQIYNGSILTPFSGELRGRLLVSDAPSLLMDWQINMQRSHVMAPSAAPKMSCIFHNERSKFFPLPPQLISPNTGRPRNPLMAFSLIISEGPLGSPI